MNSTLLGAITFIAVFAGIILVHELGHYVTSLLMRIEVEEFGIGFPPRLLRLWRNRGSLLIGKQRVILPGNTDLPFDPTRALNHLVNATADEVRGRLVLRSLKFSASKDDKLAMPAASDEAPIELEETLKDFGSESGAVRLSGTINAISQGTEFTLNWIPLGGFNRIKGESDPGVPNGMAAAKPWKRIIVLLGGAAMNLLTAVVVYMVLFSQLGVPQTERVMVNATLPGTPAETAGFQAEDIILAVDGDAMTSIDELIAYINARPGEELLVTVERDGAAQEIKVIPQASEEDGLGRIGVALNNPYRPVHSILETVPLSLRATYGFAEQLLAMPGRLITGTLSPEEAQMGGPRTIWNLFQQAVKRDTETRAPAAGGAPQEPSYYTLLLIISLTISVGVLNLLPLPALDGGRIFMSLIEVVIRRPIPAKLQMSINGIGFIVLVVLLGAFYIKDIFYPVAITLP